MSRFKPAVHLKDLRKINDDKFICNLDCERSISGDFSFTFNLTQQLIDEESVWVDFTKYLIKVEYKRNSSPKVFIVEPTIDPRSKHLHKDTSLCLYHPKEFRWDDSRSVGIDLIPSIYLWIYFNENWLEFGEWYGPEYKH
jgi:hypothetical protein